jgi:hypothetical protein
MSAAPEAADLADLLALADVPAAPSAKRPCLSTTSTMSSMPDLTIEPLSGIRIRPESRKLDREALRALSSTFDFRRLDQIPGMLRGATPLPTAWLTIAVLVDKGPTKPTNGGGGQFCVWKLSDLKRGSSATTVPVFLFGEACSGAWKELPGTAFALLAAKAVPRKDGADAGAEEAALSIDKLQQLQRIGHASEFAFCKAERRDGKPCSMWVNKEECEYCEYHVGAALRQANRAAAAPKRSPKEAGAMPPSSSHGGGSSAGVPLGAIGGVPPTLSDSRPSRPSWSAANMQKPHSEADIARAALILRESGFTFQPPDPNSSDPFKHQFKVLPKAAVAPRPASAPASAKPIPSTVATSCVRGSADVGLGVHRGLSGSVDMASRGSSFLQAFGSIDRHAKEKVLQAKPTGAASEREAAREELDRRLGTLSKKDELHEKVRGGRSASLTTALSAPPTRVQHSSSFLPTPLLTCAGPNGVRDRGDGLQVSPMRLLC